MRRIATVVVAFSIAIGATFVTAPPAAAYTSCPPLSTTFDWNNHPVCLASTDLVAENWAAGPYGNYLFHRSAAYGYVPALCFYHSMRWVGAAYGAESRYTHGFWVKEDSDGNCGGPYWNVPVETNITLYFYNIYGVEESSSLGMLYGLTASVHCGSTATLWTHHASASSGGTITGGSTDGPYDNGKCIPKIIGSDWKGGTYRVKHNMRVNTFPYQEFNFISDHVIYY